MGRFLVNLNVFLPAWGLGTVYGGQLLQLPILMVGAALQKHSQSLGHAVMVAAMPISAVVVGLVLILLWRRVGLSPQRVSLFRQGRYIFGHWLLALATLAVAVAAAGPIVLSTLLRDSNYAMLLWGLVIAIPLASLVAAAGLAMVLSSRETAADLASPNYRWQAKQRR